MKNHKTRLIIIIVLFFIIGCNKNSEENINKKSELQDNKSAEICNTIGEECGGGFLIYNEDKKLIVAPYDSSNSVQWGCRGQKLDFTETEPGTGKTNAEKIIEWHIGWEEPWFTGPAVGGYCHEKNDGTVAAQICEDLVINDYNDWFLPSKEELSYVYENKNLINMNIENMNRPEYWSSSEFGEESAWVITFDNGTGYGYQKTFLRSVRCVRYLEE